MGNNPFNDLFTTEGFKRRENSVCIRGYEVTDNYGKKTYLEISEMYEGRDGNLRTAYTRGKDGGKGYPKKFVIRELAELDALIFELNTARRLLTQPQQEQPQATPPQSNTSTDNGNTDPF